MTQNKRFADLLSEGISSVAKRRGKSVAAAEAEIAAYLGYSASTVQHWKRGHIPKDNILGHLVRFCVENGWVNRVWLQSILQQAKYPEAAALIDDLLPLTMLKPHLFICYKRHHEPDQSIALQVAQELSRQYEVFFDQAPFIDAKWGERIQSELSQSDFVVIFLSNESIHSEVVSLEIERAYDLSRAQDGRPVLLPVLLEFVIPLPQPLDTYLEPFNWTFWQYPSDTARLISELSAAVSGGVLPLDSQAKEMYLRSETDRFNSHLPPAPQTSLLDMPEGTMDLQSLFYVEREEDRIGLEAVLRQGATITIKGPRQVGKSSLLIRLKSAAERGGKAAIFLDFQLLKPVSSNADKFFHQFCATLSYLLEIEDGPDAFWSIPLPNPLRCTEYVSRRVLPALDRPLFLAMDEVDSIFDTDFRTDFFGMLRTWHNYRAFEPAWKQLDLALVTSTEPYYFIENLNQSPFNVGLVIEMQPFTEEQVAGLNRRHRSPLSPEQVHQLTTLLSGQPYLIRRALYLIARQEISAADLFLKASNEQGPFGDHLRSLLIRLHSRPALIQGLRQVLREGICLDELVFFRLRGAGLVRREQNRVLPSSPLYAEFFTRYLL